jgi:predicted RNase H-like HicB family nuclease
VVTEVEYKGFEYKVVQTANPTGWKWVISLDEMRTKAGTGFSRDTAIRFAELAIDKHLKRSRSRNSEKRKSVFD